MEPNEDLQKIAKILRVDHHILDRFRGDMEKTTGKSGVFSKIIRENYFIISDRLDKLGLGRNVSALEVYDALIGKVESDDFRIFEALGSPNLTIPEEMQRVVDLAAKISNRYLGFFLKKDVAVQLLKKEPPKRILLALGYRNVEEMLKKEDLLEVFSALRFLEDPEWLNKVFFRQYENLKPSDFEKREMVARVLDSKWLRASEGFIKKKHHNVSHLKELGVIFVLPVSLGISGETLRLLSLLSHYFNEIHFYSELFERAVKKEEDFAKNIISLLRGDVVEKRFPEMPDGTSRARLLIVQRYLAKDDSNDWRLFEPRINPEAIHWQKAEEGIVRAGDYIPALKDHLRFWEGLDWVGDYFKDEVGHDVLVSFNLVDTIMSLVKEKEMTKYLYHHQEALWNKIFIGYFGKEKMMKLIKDNIIRGWFEI